MQCHGYNVIGLRVNSRGFDLKINSTFKPVNYNAALDIRASICVHEYNFTYFILLFSNIMPRYLINRH